MRYPINGTSRLLPTLQADLAKWTENARLSKRAENIYVLKPSATWPCVLRALAFEGSSGIFCALFWQGAPLYGARAAGWVLK